MSTLFCPSNSGPCHLPLLCQDLSYMFCTSGYSTTWEIVPLGIRSTKFETTGLHAVLFSPLHYALSQVFVEGADRCGTALTHCSFSELLKMPQRLVKGEVFTINANIQAIKSPNNRWGSYRCLVGGKWPSWSCQCCCCDCFEVAIVNGCTSMYFWWLEEESWQRSWWCPLSDLMIFQCLRAIGFELRLINCLFDIEILSNRVARDCMNRHRWLNYKML